RCAAGDVHHPLGQRQTRGEAVDRPREHGSESAVVTRHRRERGYSLMEITIVLAVFGVFLYIVVSLTGEMRRQEKKYPVDFLANPEVNAVLSRLRRDVYDTKSYYGEYAGV